MLETCCYFAFAKCQVNNTDSEVVEQYDMYLKAVLPILFEGFTIILVCLPLPSPMLCLLLRKGAGTILKLISTVFAMGLPFYPLAILFHAGGIVRFCLGVCLGLCEIILQACGISHREDVTITICDG